MNSGMLTSGGEGAETPDEQYLSAAPVRASRGAREPNLQRETP
jgi:hypothetical protein